MTRLLLFLSILLMAVSAFGQKIRYIDSTNRWIYTERQVRSGGAPIVLKNFAYEQYYTGDTIMNGTQYKKQMKTYRTTGLLLKTAFIREDTINRRIYEWRNGGEKLLADFNWQLHDTVNFFVSPYGGKAVVFEKDSVLIDSSYYITIVLREDDSDVYLHLMEGIGIYGYSYTSTMGQLRCFYNNEVRPVITILADSNKGNCSDTALYIRTADYKISNHIEIYPQPAKDNVAIDFGSPLNGDLMIINRLGQLVYKKTIQGESHLVININFLQGLYFYRITDKSTSNIYSGRLIFAD